MSKPYSATGLPKGRRTFLKVFAASLAYSTLPGSEWFGSLVGETRAAVQEGTGTLLLKISDFPTLAPDFGSVRIGTSAISGNQPRGLYYPIIINRGPGNKFYALDSECTHEGCVVAAYNRTSNACICPCHGSRFRIDGTRSLGPAAADLLTYKIEHDGGNLLQIEVPDLPFSVSLSVTESGAAPPSRVRLDFLAFAAIDYEIYFREHLAAPWAVAPFSTTAAGPITQTVFAGKDDFAEVYVESVRSTGFFAVAMRTRRV